MLYIDVGNTLRGGLRTGIQRVVRSLAYELAVNSGVETRLIAFDVGAGRYFALADPTLIRSADSLADIGREARVYFDFDTFGQGDIFFEPELELDRALEPRRAVPPAEGQGCDRRGAQSRRHPHSPA